MSGFKLSADKKTLLGYEGNCPEEIVIPNDVEIIEKGAFKGKETLKKVKLHSSVKTIKSEAFARTGIQSVTLPASVQSLAKNAFSYMTMGRQKYGQPYETPSTLKIDKKSPYYFTDDKCLYELKNDELILIFCFKGGCNTVDVADGTVIIKNGAFNHCKYLTSINLPETLTTIEDNAFKGLELYSLKLPAKTTDIGTSDLSYLTDNLSNWNSYYGKEIYINNNSENLLDQLFGSGMLVADDASAMRKARGQKAKAGPKDVNWSSEVLDDGTLEITGYKGKDTTVVIPAEIGGIPVSSLCGHCLSPEKERLKKAQKEVYSKIKKIVVSAGIKMIDGYAFECCEELEEVEFNEGLESIGTRVFNCCEKLKEIVVPDTVTFIGEEAFCCGALEKLQMPNAPVRTMGTISSYNSISEPVYSGDMTKLYFYPRVSKVKEYIIPDGVKIISDGAFNGLSGCEGLEVVRVPEGIEYIGNFTFPGTLKKVYLPNSIREMDFAAFGYDESKPTLCTKNPYVIEYANENGIKVVKE